MVIILMRARCSAVTGLEDLMIGVLHRQLNGILNAPKATGIDTNPRRRPLYVIDLSAEAMISGEAIVAIRTAIGLHLRCSRKFFNNA